LLGHFRSEFGLIFLFSEHLGFLDLLRLHLGLFKSFFVGFRFVSSGGNLHFELKGPFFGIGFSLSESFCLDLDLLFRSFFSSFLLFFLKFSFVLHL